MNLGIYILIPAVLFSSITGKDQNLEKGSFEIKIVLDTLQRLPLYNIEQMQNTFSVVFVDTSQLDFHEDYFKNHRLFISKGLNTYLEEFNDSVCLQIRSENLLNSIQTHELFSKRYIIANIDQFLSSKGGPMCYMSISKMLLCKNKGFIYIHLESKDKSFHYSDLLFVISNEGKVEKIFYGEFVH